MRRLDHRRAHRLARRWPDIPPGAWLLDLGMQTDRAVRIKWAHDIQQGRAHCCHAAPPDLNPQPQGATP